MKRERERELREALEMMTSFVEASTAQGGVIYDREYLKEQITKARAALSADAPGEQPPRTITTEELERMYSASKTCFDPHYNLFWQNFTKAINHYFARAALAGGEERK